MTTHRDGKNIFFAHVSFFFFFGGVGVGYEENQNVSFLKNSR